jgi:hypothetical protein
MNERFKQLAKQCYETGPLGKDGWPEYTKFNEVKFAELIVQECAKIARATPCPYEEDEVRQRLGHTWDMACIESGREIVKHFGVGK